MRASKILYQKLQKQYSRRINLDLKRIKKVLFKLNNPENKLNNVINIIDPLNSGIIVNIIPVKNENIEIYGRLL